MGSGLRMYVSVLGSVSVLGYVSVLGSDLLPWHTVAGQGKVALLQIRWSFPLVVYGH
jgi:hypothetical protein